MSPDTLERQMREMTGIEELSGDAKQVIESLEKKAAFNGSNNLNKTLEDKLSGLDGEKRVPGNGSEDTGSKQSEMSNDKPRDASPEKVKRNGSPVPGDSQEYPPSPGAGFSDTEPLLGKSGDPDAEVIADARFVHLCRMQNSISVLFFKYLKQFRLQN